MVLHQYKPRPELQCLISRIVISQFQPYDNNLPISIPFPPQPEHCLYFYPYDKVTCQNYANDTINVLPQSILVGPQLSRVDLTMGSTMLVILVGFHPGGMHRLLRIPMEELLGSSFDSTVLLGREIARVTEQLNETTDLEMMSDIVQRYLLQKVKNLKRELPVEQILVQMIRNRQMINVDQLARQASISVRQLERQFKERIGLPPKLFSQLVRFSRAWIMKEKNADISWLSIAHSCDYADQMHMIRDFKYFAGVTPGILERHLERTPFRLQAATFN